ncbi:MAG: adenylosuccinate lyase [Spirochaetaceae bacterium]|jgi:adenylosuccinate lyase|nr:adenylosuccinate lyase [Spirochaetaceae bacterium]
MASRDIFLNLSPLDHRYSLSEKEVFQALEEFLSENAVIRFCARAEIALVKAHLGDALTAELARDLDALGEEVSPEEVYREEEITRHNIRALVNVLKRRALARFGTGAVPGASGLTGEMLASYIHLGATSVDILDTAQSLRIRSCVEQAVLPLLCGLEKTLCALAEAEAETPQVGRTHGQHAVPITFGFALAEYVSRLGKSILEIRLRARKLRGKLSGPVGAYNGTSMITPDPLGLEERYLSFLGLEPSEHSTQLVEPEYLLRLLLEINTAFGILANLADDLRNLQRSEIGEVFEAFGDGQVGSSTMPQKRNPWNSEHVKSLWKAFAPRVVTFYMDQISEHQRDLTNSASGRFVADYLGGVCFALGRMTAVARSLVPDREAMARNLAQGGGKVKGGVLAEPAYILLSESGASDAHEVIRRITLRAEEEGVSFYEALRAEGDVFKTITAQLEKLGFRSPQEFFERPENYRGLGPQRARALAQKYAALMDKISP